MPVVGFLHPSSPEPFRVRAFRQGLKDAGFIEGENVAVEYRWADDQIDRLPALATELVQRRAAVIAAAGTPSILAVKAATTTTPIVFFVAEDPVRLGHVASLARPGGNLTGINVLSIELAAKRLELLRELVPSAVRIAVLVNPANATNTESILRGVEPAARSQRQRHPRDRCRVCDACARATRRPLRRPRPLLYRSACPIGPVGRAPQGPRNISGPPKCRGRRADELRSEPGGRVSPHRRVHRTHPQRREACGFAGRAVEQVRACYQRLDRQDARPQCA